MPPLDKRAARVTKSAGATRGSKQPIQQANQQLSERATYTPLESTQVTGFGVQATYKLLREKKMPSIKVGMRFFIPRVALLVGACYRSRRLRHRRFTTAVDRTYRVAGCEGHARYRSRPFCLPAHG